MFIALAASVGIFLTKPKLWLVIYVAALSFYPSYLTVKIGTFDFMVCRILILSIYLNLLLRTNLLRQFKFVWLDKLVIIYFICQMLAGVTNTQLGRLFENRSGAMFDSLLPYFMVRLLITDKERYLFVLKGLLIIGIPLAIIGLYESVTGHNPVGFLKSYKAWGEVSTRVSQARLGFYRASVTFSNSIMFGFFFATIASVTAGLLFGVKKDRWLCYLAVGLLGVGLFSSMSSGPLLVAVFAVAFIAFYRYREHWRVAIVATVIMCGLVEIISNRHFYEVVSRFTFSSATAWYRSKLIEVGLFKGGMSGHWLAGYGLFTDPGWGHRIDGRPTDMVNHYLLVLSHFGLLGLVPFVAIMVAAAKRLIEAFRICVFDDDRWMVWCLAGALFGLAVGFMSVSLFAQMTTVFYIVIGLCGAMPVVIHNSHLTHLKS